MYYKQKSLEKNCNISVYGTVIDLVRDRVGEEGSNMLFPVFEYTVGNQKFTKRASVGSNPTRYYIGQPVHVYYNQDNYEECYLADDIVLNKLSKYFIVGGAIALAAGLAAVLLYFFYS